VQTDKAHERKQQKTQKKNRNRKPWHPAADEQRTGTPVRAVTLFVALRSRNKSPPPVKRLGQSAEKQAIFYDDWSFEIENAAV
jgi:hypothetical protein